MLFSLSVSVEVPGAEDEDTVTSESAAVGSCWGGKVVIRRVGKGSGGRKVGGSDAGEGG